MPSTKNALLRKKLTLFVHGEKPVSETAKGARKRYPVVYEKKRFT
jgi:hypothetical protein